MRMRLWRAAVAGGIAAATVTGCGSDDETLTVLAAASLTDVFEELAVDFEDDHPGVEVRLSFAGSPTLAQQIIEGAPADVYAAASPDTMAQVVDEGLAQGPVAFAANTIVLIVPGDNPAGIEGLGDLADADLRVAVCAPGVPCGDAAADLLEATGTEIAAATEESDVRSVRAKVAAGEVDAGLVYTTDVTEDVLALPTPDFGQTSYEIAAIDGGTDLAGDWIDLVASERGQAVLSDAGFSEACELNDGCSDNAG